MRKIVRVVVVDDHPLFRDGVAGVFARSRNHEVVGKGGDAAQALRLAEEFLPDILLLDINMPCSGLSVIADIRQSCPVVKIVMLTSCEEEDRVVEAMSLGARGYVLKGVSGESLLETVTSIDAGETYVSPGLAARLLEYMMQKQTKEQHTGDVNALTHREEEILDFVAVGRTNKEIARSLNISEKTVKHYMTNILNKLQVRNRVEAALVANQMRAAG